MPARRETRTSLTQTRRSPATTPEGREKQLGSMAYDLAEKQLQDGTASAQVVTHFLKAVSTREYLEQERIRMETEMLVAKREQLESQARVEELYGDAIQAMRAYSGQEPLKAVEEFDD